MAFCHVLWPCWSVWWKLGNVALRRKEMFYLSRHSTHFIYGYMVKDHGDSQKGNSVLPLYGLLFPRDRIHKSWSTGWNEKLLKASTMKDWSGNPLHHRITTRCILDEMTQGNISIFSISFKQMIIKMQLRNT